MSTLDVQLSFSRATSLIGGATGGLPYQSATSSTVFAPIGANGTILQSNGTTATWVAVSGITAGAASSIQTVTRSVAATHFLTFVDSDNGSAAAESLYTDAGIGYNPSTNALTVSGEITGGSNIIMNGAAGGTGNNLILRGGTGAASEGPQIVMGYGNNTSSAIAGQSNNTWNIDVASGLANNNFRIFRQNSGGATVVAFESTESSGGVRLISLGVGTDSSGTSGEIRAANEITAYFSSDARLKENVQVISNPIEIVNQIRGVRFDWTDEHIQKRGGEDGFFVRKHDIGVIAQEIEAVLPELVATRDDGYKAVKYEKIVPLLIEVVKAQQLQINQIREELNKLASK